MDAGWLLVGSWNRECINGKAGKIQVRQRKNGSSPLHAVNKEAEAQKLKDLPRSRRKAGVELVPEAKCPECHSGSAASICPLVLVTSASFRVGVK